MKKSDLHEKSVLEKSHPDSEDLSMYQFTERVLEDESQVWGISSLTTTSDDVNTVAEVTFNARRVICDPSLCKIRCDSCSKNATANNSAKPFCLHQVWPLKHFFLDSKELRFF